ncbi:MAG: DNA polymerase III subunit gamma/tau [Erysipelotrichaceae bacterium]|jgi:DNA polymerase-3 subunit gamma/tau|nr:DNA polymerase III subunit gamma/tau [Erysipelotrichaceae bacterium]
MSYKALYRTYRPTTFEEVSGQQHIVRTLKNALSTGKIAHAYLFAGPRGTGKTTMAKLLAKALNCDEGLGHQCNECENCIAINEGSHPDVIEIDAASNNGVEEVRDLIDKVKYSTILGRYKVYIIDEVHMMTPGAFNALLKTLEEPPENVIFILATTEPHKILATILSRCQRYDFSKLTDLEIKERLKTVLEKENVDYDDDSVNLIVSLSDGGMRDALSILDQVLAYSSNKLESEVILSMFSLESINEKIELLKLIARNRTGEVIKKIKTYIEKGTDIKRLTSDLLMILKDVLIYKTTKSFEYLEMIGEGDAKDISRIVPLDVLNSYIDILLSAEKDYKNVPAINPLFELSILKMVSLNSIEKQDIPLEADKQTKGQEEKERNIVTPKEEIILKEETQPSIFEFTYDKSTINHNILTIKNIDVSSDDRYVLNDNKVIEIMVLAKKEIKNQLLDDWNKISPLILDDELGKYASLLSDGYPLVATKDILIVEEDLPSKANKVNSLLAQAELQKVVQVVFAKRMFIYALSRKESVALQKKFIDLKQVNKLPKIETINIETNE